MYSITDDTTFAKLDRLREDINRAQGRSVPIFLVGTKVDLSSDRAVSDKERQAKARQWNSQSFEVSSKTGQGVQEVFERMVQAVLAQTSDPGKGSSGGAVFGAGKTPAAEPAAKVYKKSKCVIL